MSARTEQFNNDLYEFIVSKGSQLTALEIIGCIEVVKAILLKGSLDVASTARSVDTQTEDVL